MTPEDRIARLETAVEMLCNLMSKYSELSGIGSPHDAAAINDTLRRRSYEELTSELKEIASLRMNDYEYDFAAMNDKDGIVVLKRKYQP